MPLESPWAAGHEIPPWRAVSNQLEKVESHLPALSNAASAGGSAHSGTDRPTRDKIFFVERAPMGLPDWVPCNFDFAHLGRIECP